MSDAYAHGPTALLCTCTACWCWLYMAQKDTCVHCLFGEQYLVFMLECSRCGGERGARTWGWAYPGRPAVCLRCIGLHTPSYTDLVSGRLVLADDLEHPSRV